MSKKPARSPVAASDRVRLDIEFEKVYLLGPLFGEHDQNLIALEGQLGVYISARGNRVQIEGEADVAARARDVLTGLYNRLAHGEKHRRRRCRSAPSPSPPTRRLTGWSAPIRGWRTPPSSAPAARPSRRAAPPRSAISRHWRATSIIFALGPAGTGKTYLAVAQAVSQLIAGSVDRLVLSRPAVEAGERLGFLPGDMKDKVDPYLRPLYDALYDMLPAEQVERRLASGEIEIAPLAFMRGRTLANAFIILDEAQNTTPLQMKMFLTRFGERSRMVVCGDPNQVDLPNPGRLGAGRCGAASSMASKAFRRCVSAAAKSSATRSSGASSMPMKARRKMVDRDA